MRRFLVLLRGLSPDALFREAMRNRPREVESDAAAERAIARM